MYRILIGDPAYSSWSLRGWLLLAAFDLPFETEVVRMYDPAFEAMREARRPARTVPILEWTESGEVRRVWDTLAIAETLHERHPEAGIWPRDGRARGAARSLAAEMHSGFGALRTACPMNIHRVPAPLRSLPGAVTADVARIESLWRWALDLSGGPWLGGTRFSAADAFFAPVALRFREYALAPGAEAQAYAAGLLSHEAVARWIAMARADPRRLPNYDVA